MNIGKKNGGGAKDYTWTNAAGVSWTLTFSESFEEGGKLTFMWETFDLFPLRNIHFQFNFVSFPCCDDVGSLGIYYTYVLRYDVGSDCPYYNDGYTTTTLDLQVSLNFHSTDLI